MVDMVEKKGAGLVRPSGEIVRLKTMTNDTICIGRASGGSADAYCLCSPDGVHDWKFGKCHYCQKAEKNLDKGSLGLVAYPGGAPECSHGGKCMFKFAKCTKCGKSELEWMSELGNIQGIPMFCPKISSSHFPEVSQKFLPEASPDPDTSPEGDGDQITPLRTRDPERDSNNSGYCLSSPDGVCLYRFGKCHYCQKAEKDASFLDPGTPGQVAYPGAIPDCGAGGKCMFKFATCTKCGKSELDYEFCNYGSDLGSLENPLPSVGRAQPSPLSSLQRRSKPGGYVRNERIRVDCPECGFTCVPQWMNDEASCLKCHTVLMVQSTCHEPKFEARIVEPSIPASAIMGSPLGRKYTPSSAMEALGGGGFCKMSPDGKHHWKYGKCNYCQIGQGEFMKGFGLSPYPGGVGECAGGGKCMFKFARCVKCGASELLF